VGKGTDSGVSPALHPERKLATIVEIIKKYAFFILTNKTNREYS